jgi:hypothetical protein
MDRPGASQTEPIQEGHMIADIEQRSAAQSFAPKSCHDLESATVLESIDIGKHRHLPVKQRLFCTSVD